MSAVLNFLEQAANQQGGRAVLRSGSAQLCAAELLARVDDATEKLAGSGVSTLALAADNSIDWIIADLAAQQTGIPVVPLPPFFSSEQIAHVLANSGADGIAADEAGSRFLQSRATRFGLDLTGELTLLRLAADAVPAEIPSGTAKISYTSGTTGTPKGVCLSQAVLDRVAGSVRAATESMDLRRHLCLLPLATLLENVAGVYAPLLGGAEVVVLPLAEVGTAGAAGFDVDRFFRVLTEVEPESLILLPQMLADLVGAIEQGAQLPESLRFVAVGGGVVGLPLLERAGRAGVPVFEGYGLTECGSVVALNTVGASRRGSVGQPLPHVGVRIARDGEIFVSGSIMNAFLGDGSGPIDEIATGDVGSIDADGYLHIKGRKKNVFVTSFGRNLSPEWVEAELTGTGSIRQAALFGDGRPFNVAVIVPHAGASVNDIERGLADVNRRLPDYARIRYWIRATEAFSPFSGTATANGRLRRPAIHARYRLEIEACYADSFESYAIAGNRRT